MPRPSVQDLGDKEITPLTPSPTLARSAAAPWRAILRACAAPFFAHAAANAQVREYDRLARLSDASLARMGLSRGELPAYVARER